MVRLRCQTSGIHFFDFFHHQVWCCTGPCWEGSGGWMAPWRWCCRVRAWWSTLVQEMDYVLLLKWPGDTHKNTGARITEIEGGEDRKLEARINKGFVKLPHQSGQLKEIIHVMKLSYRRHSRSIHRGQGRRSIWLSWGYRLEFITMTSVTWPYVERLYILERYDGPPWLLPFDYYKWSSLWDNETLSTLTSWGGGGGGGHH